MKSIGILATVLATMAVCAGGIMFSLAQTTTTTDSVIMCGVAIALSLFGMTLLFVARIDIEEKGFTLTTSTMVLIALVLMVCETMGFYGWKSNVDYLFGENTEIAKTDKLKLEIAQAKVNAMAVSKVDSIKAAKQKAVLESQLARKSEQASLKCKAWRPLCNKKEMQGAGELEVKAKAIDAQLNAQSNYLAALDNAQSTIKETEKDSDKKTHRAFQGLALLFDESSLKVQSAYRLTISALVVILSHLGFIFYAGSERKYVDIAKRIMNQSPAPTPAISIKKPIKNMANYYDAITNHKFNPALKPAPVVAAKPEPYNLYGLDEKVNQQNEKLGFIGFCDPENMPVPGAKAAIPKAKDFMPEGGKKDAIKKDIERPSIGTAERTQSRTVQVKKATSKGRGKSAGLEFKAIEDAVINGDFFKFKDTISIRNLVDYSRYISPNDSGIGKDTASVYVTMLKENGRPLNKGQWESLKGQQVTK